MAVERHFQPGPRLRPWPSVTERNTQLLARWAKDRDPAVRESLIRAYSPMARSLAHRFSGRGEPVDDLVQVALIGLMQAVDHYDAERATRFEAYAVPTIVGHLKRHFRDHTWSVRLPRQLRDLVLRMRALEQDGRTRTAAEIAARLDVGIDAVMEALEAKDVYTPLSLDAAVHEDDTPWIETLGGADPGFEAVETAAHIRQLTRTLDDRQRRVLALRYREDLTQRQIGMAIGCSQMTVSRVLDEAAARMRDAALAA